MSGAGGPGQGPAADALSTKDITPVERVLSHLEGVRRSGSGSAMARCPHHDDRTASLSIKEGTDGRALIHCNAGCASADVVVSAGLSFPDLFPPGSRERLKARVWRGTIAMNPEGRPALVSFGDDQVAALLAELARLAKVRNTLDKPIAAALKAVAAAVGISPQRLTEAVRAALATEEPA